MGTLRSSGKIIQSTGAPYAPIRFSRFHSVKTELGTLMPYNIKTVMDTNAPTLYCRIDDGGVFTNDDTDAASAAAADVTLLPAAEAIDDALYIGANVPFNHFIIKLSTAGVGNAVAWEGYVGGAWQALTGLTDNTTGLTAGTSYYKVSWTDTLALTTVNGQSGYWVRARVTAANFTTIPVATRIWAGGQDGYEIYADLLLDGSETHLVIGTSIGATRPKWDIYINTVLDGVGGGQYDDYNASTDDLTRDITVTQPFRKGWNEIKLKVNGKNASSTAYDLNLYGVGAY